MSRLTFNIEQEVALVGVKREKPWTALREKLFGTGTGGVPVRPAPLTHIRQRAVQRALESWPAPSSLSKPEHSFARPGNSIARTPPTAFVPAPVRPPSYFQVEYKGRQIIAYRSQDGSWTATHFPLDADLSAPRDFTDQEKHRFAARVLAVASVEIEIDDLEQS